ncbi:hypothetical protein CLOP_g13854 [Closterium sp. NIES-67]|nr:hypothetical protein CLOP_g13854 [Closterium sp. NIES-67]
MAAEAANAGAEVNDATGGSNGVEHKEEWVTNSRGMKLMSASWVPANRPLKALILLLHGYGFDCTTYFQATAERLASEGYGVYGIDFEGHGRSEGLSVFIPDFNTLVDDSLAYFAPIRERPEHQSIPKFLCGESMGGAVALCIHRKQPDQWDGAIFMAPMCKISAKVRPPAILVQLVQGLAYVLPTWQIVPSADIVTSSIRDPEKLKKIAASPYTYRARPRMRTALTMLHASQDAERTLDQVSLPFLLLHGDADIVTELEGSQALYDKARSEDKTFKVYKDAWHLLTEGEPEETAEEVLRDMIGWLDERSQRKSTSEQAKA